MNGWLPLLVSAGVGLFLGLGGWWLARIIQGPPLKQRLFVALAEFALVAVAVGVALAYIPMPNAGLVAIPLACLGIGQGLGVASKGQSGTTQQPPSQP